MLAPCQLRHFAPQQTAFLFDHLVGVNSSFDGATRLGGLASSRANTATLDRAQFTRLGGCIQPAGGLFRAGVGRWSVGSVATQFVSVH